ncbi:MAG: hypothetical protein E5W91_32035 [Mesorhizobium sp.]|uniref:hypothetical protein n=1 Tax=Mesorhizobium sp. TaxID=1871066 RepID=UPI0011FCB103|nr:hypothetical protein [Mesorhizobium sp.]TIS53195.1 MAG: hypothetical protein E5W91_32035 [Mesorhizobium sp.]
MTMHLPVKWTMADVKTRVSKNAGIPVRERRDMVSAITRLASLTGKPLGQIPAELYDLADLLGTIQPIAAGIQPKTLANIKANCLNAISRSGIIEGLPPTKLRVSKTPEWQALLKAIKTKSLRFSVSSIANWGSRNGISPRDLDTEALDLCMAERRQTSFRCNQHRVHRQRGKDWNKVATQFPRLGLKTVTVPASRRKYTRVPFATFSRGFRDDWADFSEHGRRDDLFADGARDEALAESTLVTMLGHVHHAASILVQSGVPIESIWGLADLVTPKSFERVLRELLKGGTAFNYYGHSVARTLLQIAKWLGVDAEQMAELKRLARAPKRPRFGMTQKNKLLVRQINDPDRLKRLHSVPETLWRGVMSSRSTSRLRLAKAQAALGIGILLSMPIRLTNLTSLAFDEHLVLRVPGVSTLSLSEDETKNDYPLEFDIPPTLAKMMLEYRDVVCPAVMRQNPKYLFSNVDGTVKGFAGVRYLVQRYVKQHIGIHMNPHIFRHLAADFILDKNPGAHVLVQHLLGHKKLATTAIFYAGADTRRAGRHHQALLEQALEDRTQS